MSTREAWLDRLDNVSDYRALQHVFAEIAARAQGRRDDAILAQKIDEVIRRIEQERASDERELAEIQGRYESFTQENRGVVGWLKRHVPFTEARRQDVQRRAELADQQAEVLADNLVIARAQMLKEGLLGNEARRLGRRPTDCHAQLEAAQTAAALPMLAAGLKSLQPEIEQARAFLELVRKDVEAFAGAAFSSKEDRQRRDADLAAARRELAELTTEVDQKVKVKQDGMTRLGRLVTDELTTNDSGFRDDARQLAELDTSLDRLAAVRVSLESLAGAAEKIGEQTRELETIPPQVQQSRVERQQIERRQSDAAIGEARKSAVADERRARCEEARWRLEQAQQSLAAVQRADAAWRPEHAPPQSLPQPAQEIQDASPHATHLREAKAAVELAQAALAETSQAFEMAKHDADQARAALTAGNGQLAAADAKLAALEQRRVQLQHELPQSSLAGQAAFAKTATALAAFLGREIGGATRDAPPYGCVNGSQLNATWGDALLHADHDLARHLQAAALLEQLMQWRERQQEQLERNRQSISERHTSVWRRRCHELVGDLAREI